MENAQIIKNPAAQRYANALYELAQSNRKENEVNRELQSFGKIIRDSQNLRRFIQSPTIPPKQKLNAIKDIIRKINYQKIVENFILVITKNRRLNIIEDIINAYQNKMIRHYNQINAEIITAQDIDSEGLQKITQIIQKNSGKEPIVKTHTDPDIIGGVIVKVGSRMFDNSIRTKLQKIKNNMEDI